MNYRVARALVLSLLMVSAAAQSLAASFMVPTDREMIQASKAIVVATVVSSYPVRTADGFINTIFEFRVEQVLKGSIDASATLRLMEGGGALDGKYQMVPEAPQYATGERALIFVRGTSRAEDATYGMTLGKFNFVKDLHGTRLLLRGASEGEIFGWDADGSAHVEPVRSEEKFVAYIREVVSGAKADEAYTVEPSTLAWPKPKSSKANSSGFHACDYLLGPFGPGCGGRWETIFDFPSGNGTKTWQVVGTQANVDAPTAIDRGINAWNGDALSNVNFQRSPAASSAPFDSNDGILSIHLSDTADIGTAGCDPNVAVGCTRISGGSTHSFDGGTMISLSDADMAIKAAFTTSQTVFDEVMTHELGHGLGFRHSNQGTPNTGSAIMNSVTFGSFGSGLQAWDKDAVETVYNPSPAGVCAAPGISVQPVGSTINSGQSASLSVTATGTAPLTYAWFTGSPASPGAQVGTSATTSVSPTVTTTYFVKVTNSCGNINSSTVTVTVNSACSSPSIITHPQSQTINSGQQVTLSVAATGGTAPYSIQWFTGNPGSGTPLSGQTSSSLTVSPTTTTTYYAAVTSQCGGTATNSNAATITVSAGCSPPSITLQPQSQTITTGTTATLSMGYTGTSGVITWYQGTPPNKSQPVGSGQQFTTPALTGPASFWAEIVNGCGSAPTVAANITVSAGCAPPTITLNPQSTTINSGQTATLTMGYSGTSGTVTWYQGTPPNRSQPVGTGQQFTTPALTTSTSYWAEIVNACNSAQTTAATVTVNPTGTPFPTCTAPAISTQPVSTSIILGGPVVLSVTATGTAPLSYQWFQGPKGDTSKPVGTNSSTFTSGALNANTSFWVRVSNTCGTQTADSNAADVAVTVARHRSARH